MVISLDVSDTHTSSTLTTDSPLHDVHVPSRLYVSPQFFTPQTMPGIARSTPSFSEISGQSELVFYR